jgi:glycine cleavage system H protein
MAMSDAPGEKTDVPECGAVLPCNGLDKPAGVLAREIALALVESLGCELICPVLYNAVPDRYAEAAQRPLLVIDGCATRCASRLAAEHGLKVTRKVQVTEAFKEAGEPVGEALRPSPEALAACRRFAQALLAAAGPSPAGEAELFETPVEYATVTRGKFAFRIPMHGYLFNENHCWARIAGNRARVGISDYMQQELSDLTFCEPPEVGAEVEQFGEIGSVESVKAVADVISPVSGRVVAVNAAVAAAPEVINEDPYGRGWIAEVELLSLGTERELLLDGPGYLEFVRRKAAEHEP